MAQQWEITFRKAFSENVHDHCCQRRNNCLVIFLLESFHHQWSRAHSARDCESSPAFKKGWWERMVFSKGEESIGRTQGLIMRNTWRKLQCLVGWLVLATSLPGSCSFKSLLVIIVVWVMHWAEGASGCLFHNLVNLNHFSNALCSTPSSRTVDKLPLPLCSSPCLGIPAVCGQIFRWIYCYWKGDWSREEWEECLKLD